jgi:hypothetical protein
MKAALEAWGADSNLFHQGAAKESDDPDVTAAAMKKPGVVLKRPIESDVYDRRSQPQIRKQLDTVGESEIQTDQTGAETQSYAGGAQVHRRV